MSVVGSYELEVDDYISHRSLAQAQALTPSPALGSPPGMADSHHCHDPAS